MRILIQTIALCIGLISIPAAAQEWPSLENTTAEALPAPIQKAQQDGAQVRYLGQHDGIDGWMVYSRGRPSFAYSPQGTKAFIQGMLYSDDGDNVTLRQLQNMRLRDGDSFDVLSQISRMAQEEKNRMQAEMSAQEAAEETEPQVQTNEADQNAEESAQTEQTNQPLSPSERLMVDLENTNWSIFGSRRAPVMYALIDPDCPYCRVTMRELQPYMDAGEIQLRMIPIGFTPKSQRVSALILAALDGEAMFFDYISGQAPQLGSDPNVNVQGVIRNKNVIESWGFDLTPILFYRDSEGTVKIVRGEPANYEQLIADLTGSEAE